jgi:putative intracellular protease/amidase
LGYYFDLKTTAHTPQQAALACPAGAAEKRRLVVIGMFIQGKTITGFANSEEDYADQIVGQKTMPFRIEDEANKLGANFVTKEAFAPHALYHFTF